MDQPHMLAYINPAEEQMLRDMGGAGIPGPDGIPVYGLYESITGTKFEDTALGGALGVNTGGTFGSGGSLDNAYNAVTGGGYTGNSGSSEDMDRARMNARNDAAAAVKAAAACPKASTINTPGITGFPGKCPWTKKLSFLTLTMAFAEKSFLISINSSNNNIGSRCGKSAIICFLLSLSNIIILNQFF